MSRPSHIFIVGSSRTGTSLMRNILNSSKDVALCYESQFLSAPKTVTSLYKWLLKVPESAGFYRKTHLLKKLPSPGAWETFQRVGDISTDVGAKKVVEYIYQRRPAFWYWLADNIDREEFLRMVLESDRTERSFLNLLLTLYARGKLTCGEKTPYYIHHVPTLLEWFPNAKIVHMFRDVRAIFVSQQRKKFNREAPRISIFHHLSRRSRSVHEVYISMGVAIQWLRIVQLHSQYAKAYPKNYYLCRAEDVFTKPADTLPKLCDFLEIEFTDTMLQQSVRNSSFNALNEMQGLDAAASDRWRQHVPPTLERWLTFFMKKHLLEFGYEL